MGIIDAYGDFELPEEKSVIEVVEDPIKIIDACYEIFLKILDQKNKNNPAWMAYDTEIEKYYLECCRIFEGKEKLKAEQKDLLDFLEGKVHSGLFVSALQNITSIDKLIIDKPKNNEIHQYMGHRLKPNKLLINKAGVCHLGRYCEGTIINMGKIHCCFAKDANGGLQITTKRVRGPGAKKGIRIAAYGQYLVVNNHHLEYKNIDYIIALDNKIRELNFLYLNEATDLIEKVEAFDWKKWEKEIAKIANEIIINTRCDHK